MFNRVILGHPKSWEAEIAKLREDYRAKVILLPKDIGGECVWAKNCLQLISRWSIQIAGGQIECFQYPDAF